MQKILMTCVLTLGFALSASAQTSTPKKLPKKTAPSQTTGSEQAVVQTPSVDPSTGAPVYQFNTLGNPSTTTDDRKGMTFKAPTDPNTTKNDVMANPEKNMDDSSEFKTYIGYPKHQLQISYLPTNVASKWNYKGQDFNYTYASSNGFELLYRFVATPQINVELDYTHYTVHTDATNSVIPYVITDSSADVDGVFARFNYFWIGDRSFYFRYGPGFELGYDSYPILNFTDSNKLAMSTVKDVTVGLNFHLEYPLISSFILQSKVGYNYGTGAGNSGTLTSRNNNSYYLDAGVLWNMSDKSAINIGVDYRVRKASIDGTNGFNKDSWDTTATNTAFNIGYTYTF